MRRKLFELVTKIEACDTKHAATVAAVIAKAAEEGEDWECKQLVERRPVR